MAHSPLRRLSVIDQAVEHLSDGIRSGRWKNHLPGMIKLAGELGVSRNTTVEAVRRLIAEGVILPAAGCNPHAIAGLTAVARDASGPRHLRVAMLMMTAIEQQSPAQQREIMRVIAELKTAGHECIPVLFPPGKNANKTDPLPRLIRESGADAWMVYNGRREILEWFASGEGGPALAIGGRCKDLPIAAAVGYDIAAVVRDITRRLIELGHRRIVMICENHRRRPKPGRMILAFREELEATGIKPGEFNTPDWEETPEGLIRLLQSLFRFTPPTALICCNLDMTRGTAAFLTRQGLEIPGEVSIASITHADAGLAWIFPGMDFAHLEEDDKPAFRRIREWVTQVAGNRADLRQVWNSANFVEGNTIGPAKSK